MRLEKSQGRKQTQSERYPFFFYLKQVFNAHGRPSGKSQKVVDNILKFFPDFDAFPLSPPSSKAEVIQNLTEEGRQGEISASFKKGVEDFKLMLRTKLSPKRSVSGQVVVTGEGWSNILNSLLRLLYKAGRTVTLNGYVTRQFSV